MDESEQKFWSSVGNVQARVPAVPREAIGQVGGRQYRYATLDGILAVLRPILAEEGLTVSFVPCQTGVRAIVSGHGHIETWDVPYTDSYERFTPQARGSEITYIKRYFLGSFFLIATEDDDDAAIAQDAVTSAVRRSEPVVSAAVEKGRSEEDEERKKAIGRLYAILRKRGVTEQEDVRQATARALGIPASGLGRLTTEQITRAADIIAASAPQEHDPFNEV